MKVFLIGGAGFIGAEIARQLLELNHEVILFDAFIDFIGPLKSNYALLLKKRLEPIQDKVTMIKGDIRNPAEISNALQREQPDKVVFLAALPIATSSNKEPETAFSINMVGLKWTLEALKNLKSLKQFIYTSSSMVYGDFQYTPCDEEHPKDPKCVYGGVKYSGEILTRVNSTQYGLPYTIIRPSAVYGPTDNNRRVSQIFLENAMQGKPLILHNNGESMLDFTYIEDIAQGFVKALTNEKALNQTFNITAGNARSLKDLAEIIKQFVPDLKIEYAEVAKDEKRPERGSLSIKKAKELIGYEPRYTLEQGMKKYFEFQKSIGIFK